MEEKGIYTANEGYFSNFTRLLVRYNAEELSMRVSSLPLDAHRRVSTLKLKTQRLIVRYNAEELSLRVSPLPLNAYRRVLRLMLKTQCHAPTHSQTQDNRRVNPSGVNNIFLELAQS